MPASDTIKQPVARYQAVSTRRIIPQQLPCPAIPLAVARIDKMVSGQNGTRLSPSPLVGEGLGRGSLFVVLRGTMGLNRVPSVSNPIFAALPFRVG